MYVQNKKKKKLQHGNISCIIGIYVEDNDDH